MDCFPNNSAPRSTAGGPSRFEILGPLGSGGMGRVWRARDRRLGRVVALKSFAVAAGEARPMIEAEARAAAPLHHPGIATVFELAEVDGGLVLVMEYVEGETLAARLAGGPLEVAEAVGLFGRLADAVAAAHGRGVVHGDLTSANVMLTAEDQPKILDFGLARLRGTGSTPGAEAAGTLPYVAPEVLSGAPAGQRSDLYALGVLLYEALAGRRPFGTGGALGEPPPAASISTGRTRGCGPGDRSPVDPALGACPSACARRRG